MTDAPDNLTLDEVESWRVNAKLPIVIQLATQLADTMRENERLRLDYNMAMMTVEHSLKPHKYLMDGGCQMPKTVINGHCAVCGSPKRTCQPQPLVSK